MAHKSLRYGCCQVYQQKPNNKFNGHEYVDLGLPSGTLWAKMNVGAESETDAGLYFAWGETQGYTASQVGTDKQFSWDDYALTEDSGSTMSKYNASDNKTHLELTDDAANVNMGGDWHMPTNEQTIELFKKTKNGFVTNAGAFTQYAWSDSNGYSSPTQTTPTISNWNTAGYFFFKNTYTSVTEAISAEDYLFVPAAGNCKDGEVNNVGNNGNVWASALNSESVENAWDFVFNSVGAGVSNYGRYYGRSVVSLIKLTNLVSFMGCWRSRLAQEAYTFKVGGSSPSHPTLFNFKLNKYDEKVTNFCNDCRLSFFLLQEKE